MSQVEVPPLVSAARLGDVPLNVGGAQDQTPMVNAQPPMVNAQTPMVNAQPPMVNAIQDDSPLVSTALDRPLKRMKRAGYKPPPAEPIFFPPDQYRLAAREARIGYIADAKEKADAELDLETYKAQHDQEARRLDMANAKRTQDQAEERKRLLKIQIKQVDDMYEAHDEKTVSKVHEIQREALYTHGRAAVTEALSTCALVHHYVEIINTTGAPKHGEVVAGGREEVREYLFRIFLAEHGTILRISDRFYDDKDFTLVCKDNHCQFAVRMKRITQPEHLNFTSVKSFYARMNYPLSSTPLPPAFVIVIPFATHCAHCRVSGEESKWRDSLWLTLDKNDVRRLLVSDRSFTSSNLRSEWFNMLHMVPKDEEALRLGLLNAVVIRGFLPSHGVASHHFRDYRHVPQDLLELVAEQMQRRFEEATVGEEDVAQPVDAAQQPATHSMQSSDHTSVPMDVALEDAELTSRTVRVVEAAASYHAQIAPRSTFSSVDEDEEMREKVDFQRMQHQPAVQDKQLLESNDYDEAESLPVDGCEDEHLKNAPADYMTAQSAHLSIDDEVNTKGITDLAEVVDLSPDASTVQARGLSVIMSDAVLTQGGNKIDEPLKGPPAKMAGTIGTSSSSENDIVITRPSSTLRAPRNQQSIENFFDAKLPSIEPQVTIAQPASKKSLCQAPTKWDKGSGVAPDEPLAVHDIAFYEEPSAKKKREDVLQMKVSEKDKGVLRTGANSVIDLDATKKAFAAASDPSFKPLPIHGFKNTNSMCFIIGFLQLVLRVDPFVCFFDQIREQDIDIVESDTPHKGAAAVAMFDLISELRMHPADAGPFSLHKFKNQIGPAMAKNRGIVIQPAEHCKTVVGQKTVTVKDKKTRRYVSKIQNVTTATGQSFVDCMDFGESLLDMLYTDIVGSKALDEAPCVNGTCARCLRDVKHNIISDLFYVYSSTHRHCGTCQLSTFGEPKIDDRKLSVEIRPPGEQPPTSGCHSLEKCISFSAIPFPSVCANSSEERKAQFDEHKRVHPDCLVASHNDRPNGSASRPDAICKVWGDFVDAHPHHPQCNLNLTLVSSPKYLILKLIVMGTNADGQSTKFLDRFKIPLRGSVLKCLACPFEGCPQRNELDQLYELVGFVTHHGKWQTEGHFTATVWRADVNKWIYCDDDKLKDFMVLGNAQARASGEKAPVLKDGYMEACAYGMMFKQVDGNN